MSSDKIKSQEEIEFAQEIAESLADYIVEEFDEEKYIEALNLNAEEVVEENESDDEISDVDDEFFAAVENEDVEKLKEIIDRVIEIDKQDKNGDTPLLFAVKQKNVEMIRILLEAAADTKILDKNERSCFDIAEEYFKTGENIEIYKLFTE